MLAFLLFLVLKLQQGLALRLMCKSHVPYWSTRQPIRRTPIPSIRCTAMAASSDGRDMPLDRIHAIDNSKVSKYKALFFRAISSSAAYLVGDAIAQWISHSKVAFQRSLAMASFGFCVHAPMSNLFYTNIKRVLPDKSVRQIIKKVIIEQILWSPVLSLLFISYLGCLNRLRWVQIFRRILIVSPKLITVSWSIWFSAHFLNFVIIPRKWRLPLFNCAQIAYCCAASLLTS